MAPISSAEVDLMDRMARLETTIDLMSKTLEENTNAVKNLNNVLQQARGAKWAIMLMAGFFGFVGSEIGAVLTFMAGLPK